MGNLDFHYLSPSPFSADVIIKVAKTETLITPSPFQRRKYGVRLWSRPTTFWPHFLACGNFDSICHCRWLCCKSYFQHSVIHCLVLNPLNKICSAQKLTWCHLSFIIKWKTEYFRKIVIFYPILIQRDIVDGSHVRFLPKYFIQ